MNFACTLLGEPTTGNHRTGRNRWSGKTYVTAQARDYEMTAGLTLVAVRARLGWRCVRWCRVKLTFWNMPHDGDVDGLMKGVLDCLQRAGIVENDRYVVQAVVSKRWDDGGARTDVEVQAVDPAAWGVPAAAIGRGAALALRRAARPVGGRPGRAGR